MTKENRELLIRALGEIDGISLAASSPIDGALVDVIEKLESILESESKE